MFMSDRLFDLLYFFIRCNRAERLTDHFKNANTSTKNENIELSSFNIHRSKRSISTVQNETYNLSENHYFVIYTRVSKMCKRTSKANVELMGNIENDGLQLFLEKLNRRVE